MLTRVLGALCVFVLVVSGQEVLRITREGNQRTLAIVIPEQSGISEFAFVSVAVKASPITEPNSDGYILLPPSQQRDVSASLLRIEGNVVHMTFHAEMLPEKALYTIAIIMEDVDIEMTVYSIAITE